MSDEQQDLSTNIDNTTPITRAWRLGGPMTSAQRKKAKELFLDYLKRDPNVTAAADHAGIHRDTAYRWREKDHKFDAEWGGAIERLNDVARSSIFQRGIYGWDEPVVSMGQVVYEMIPVVDADGEQVFDKGRPKMQAGNPITIHKWSDQLAIAYARANLPEYKDRQQIDLNAQITDMAESAKDELLADLAAAIANETESDEHEDHSDQDQG
jgi:hypothetical protein